MTKILKINAKEICRVLAEKYNCDEENVHLIANRESRGYGLGEYEEIVISARLEKSVDNDKCF